MAVLSDKYRGTTLYIRVKSELVRAAQYRGITTYQDVALIAGLPMSGNHMGHELGLLLGAIAEDEVVARRPMLSAVVVRTTGQVGPGFYDLARELKRPGHEDHASFLASEREAAYDAWKRPLPPE